MLTGEPPYAGRNAQDVRKQILDGPPKPIRARNPEADSGMTAIAQGAMARELRERYADMTDVLADLQRIKQGKTPHRSARSGPERPPRAATGLDFGGRGVDRARAVDGLAHDAGENAGLSRANEFPAGHFGAAGHPAHRAAVRAALVAADYCGRNGRAGRRRRHGHRSALFLPGGVAEDTAGNIYVADTGNHTIRKISPAGEVRTLAGMAGKPGQTDDIGDAARFLAPMGIAVDGEGNVYVAEFANNIIRKISPQGSVITLAGSAASPGWRDGAGDNAHFRNPWALAVDKSGNVYVADKDNFVIRKITPDGRVSTLAGKAGEAGFHDGHAGSARFNDPRGVAVDGSGNVYVADTGNNAVRKITAAGVVSTIARSLSNPDAIAADALGAVYFTDAAGLHRIVNGQVERMPALALTSNPDGPLAAANGIAVDGRGALCLADTVKNIIVWQPAPREAR